MHYSLRDSSRQADPELAQVSLKLNMSRAFTKAGDSPNAREFLEEPLSVYMEWWGRRHPETMRAIDELAWTLMEDWEAKDAKGEIIDPGIRLAGELWNEALDFYQRTEGDASDTVARIVANLIQLSSHKTIDALNPMTPMDSISPASTQTGH